MKTLTRGVKIRWFRHLGIEFTESGDDFVGAAMPIDHRTVQPAGILHGGASLALAETLGSVSGFLRVGMEINADHIRPIRSGRVYGIVRPIHVGKKTHVWEITISN